MSILVQSTIEERALKDNKNTGWQTKTVSMKYLNNIKSSIGFKNGNAERTMSNEEITITIARAKAKAISDIRNIASFAAANHYIVPKVNYKLVINADATQFQLGGDSKRKTKVIHDKKRYKH